MYIYNGICNKAYKKLNFYRNIFQQIPKKEAWLSCIALALILIQIFFKYYNFQAKNTLIFQAMHYHQVMENRHGMTIQLFFKCTLYINHQGHVTRSKAGMSPQS